MKFGIALFPSKKLQDTVNQYRKRYDSRYAYIAPHITVKEAFEAEEHEKPHIEEFIRHVASKHQPTEIEIKKVSSFAPTAQVIYFKVEPNETLTSIHDSLNKGDFYGESTHQFVPHFTLAQEDTTQKFEDVYSHLKMIGIEHSEVLDKISLCVQLDNGIWHVTDTFKLGQ
ncbi:2'-5' RNA ligase family protein [Jeotgalicoccus meleagridis]|uniref:Putative phosphoesterase JEODO184_01771 n=1 Tax=Jeotgalicoccus meleagridis TaxID=2759181 RepID=A0A6V7RN40_9STAP|nr:2'-5' RNA ligase family protein [Jeotgalicoccus meleagridis]CAD2079841.1 2',5' RNA ligase family [Jeotgalicoccus meleagridis]HIW37410.1 2'-5' RNA ligase family protein [Candidatus Jeotgalicoccus stercoravium]